MKHYPNCRLGKVLVQVHAGPEWIMAPIQGTEAWKRWKTLGFSMLFRFFRPCPMQMFFDVFCIQKYSAIGHAAHQ
jgi:hypothetical protein